VSQPSEPEVVTEAPETPTPPAEEIVTLLAPIAPRPAQRPVDRVAPTPVAQPDPQAEIAETLQEAVVPDETSTPTEQPLEEQVATAPEEAATEIVTEAEEQDELASSAPTTSPRPSARPERPTRTAEPLAETSEQSESDPLSAAIGNAVNEAQENENSASNVPVGPPLTSGDKDALRLAIKECWNVGSLSSEALRTTVVVGVSVGRDGVPISSSIRMLSSEGGSGGAAQQAYEAGRRAILRCGARGFNLPIEKYDQWQEIEITFNPESMRIK